MFSGSTRRGPTKIAQTTEELIAFDRLNPRDKELLEKSQVVLGLSKLYEIESDEQRGKARNLSGARTRDPNSAKKSVLDSKSTPLASKIQMAQQRLLEKERQEDQTHGSNDGPSSGIAKVRELIYEVDMIK